MFFRGHHKLTVLFAIATALLLLLTVLASGMFWLTDRSATAEGLAGALISNPQIRQNIADRILDQISDGADTKTRMVIRLQRPELRNAIAAQLTDPVISREITNDVRIGYNFLVSEQKSTPIDLRPLLPSILAIMSTIDPQLDTKKILKGIEPIHLRKTDSIPDIGKWLNLLKSILIGLIVLLLLSLLLLFRYAASAKSALKTVGIEAFVIGVLAVILFFGGVAAATSAANKATDPTVAAVVPIAARQLLAYFRNLGLVLAAVGLISFLASIRFLEVSNGAARGEQRSRSA